MTHRLLHFRTAYIPALDDFLFKGHFYHPATSQRNCGMNCLNINA